MALELPKYEFMNEETLKKLRSRFKGIQIEPMLVGPQKWILSRTYTEQGAGFYNIKARPDDTWVLSFPRSGTTLTQELVWLLSNNLDFERAKKEYLKDRFLNLQSRLITNPEIKPEIIEMNNDDKGKELFCKAEKQLGYEVVENIPSPRFIKSHIPITLLPGILDVDCKVVYVARNPKDVAVSFFHFSKNYTPLEFVGDFPTFWDYFQNNIIPYGPYWEHLKAAWALKDRPNFLFMFYEEMQQDFQAAIKKVAMFLGKSYTEEQLRKLADHLHIKNFRDNPMVNYSQYAEHGFIPPGAFIRKGETNGWKDMFTPDLDAKANKWIEENLKGTDLTFPYFDYNV